MPQILEIDENNKILKENKTEIKKDQKFIPETGVSIFLGYSIFVVMGFMLTAMIIYWNSQIIEKKYSITKQQRIRRTLLKVNESLKTEVSKLSSLSRIEHIAREKLGMVSYPKSIRHINSIN